MRVDQAVEYVDHNVVALDFKNPDDHRMLQALARASTACTSAGRANGMSH